MKNRISFLFIALIALNLFSVSALTINSFSSNPEKVKPGEVVELRIELDNNLKENAEDVTIELDLTNLPFSPYSSSSEQSIDEIEEDEEEVFLFKLIADHKADSKIYKIPVKISYSTSNASFSKIGFVSVIVNAEPRLKIVAEGYLIQYIEGEISVRVINDGLSDVRFVSIELMSGRYQTNSQMYEYIGDIDSDDFDSVEYKISTGTSDSEISLPVKVRYTDSSNKEIVKEELLPIPVYSKAEAQEKGLISGPNYALYSAIVLVVLLYIFFRLRRKNRLKNE